MTDYTVAVLEDAIRILEILQEDCDGLSLAELTEESGLVKNKVFRILYTLEKHDLVERNDGRDYRLGLRFLEFAQSVQMQTSLLEASRPVMDRLVQETRESIFLGVVSGTDALCVAARVSPRSIRLFAEVGRRAPLHSGGVPKILCAYLPDEERAELLDQLEHETAGGEPPLVREVLEKQLAEVREQGYAVVVDELDRGAHSVAAPIRDHEGAVIAAISIAGPSHRFTKDRVEAYIRLVQDAAQQISRALGYMPRESMRSNSHKVESF